METSSALPFAFESVSFVPASTRRLLEVAAFAASASIAVAQSPRVLSSSAGCQHANSFTSLVDLSADGRFAAFGTPASNLVPSDTNGQWDVYVRDLALATTTMVSVGDQGTLGNGNASRSSISGDGRFVAFLSLASNFAPGDQAGTDDVFVHDRDPDVDGIYDEDGGVTELVSVPFAGTGGAGGCDVPTLSPDGRYVVFESDSGALVAGDTNSAFDVFLRDRLAGSTERISVSSSGIQGALDSFSGSISGDGRFVVFSSSASAAPGDSNGVADVFLRDRVASTTRGSTFNATQTLSIVW